MTINEVLTSVDELKPNQYDDQIKIRWISVLEGKIVDEIFRKHVLEGRIEFNGYTLDDMDVELLVPDTYADLYSYYCFAMIDAMNGETARYASSMALFNAAFSDFSHYYNRENMPLSNPLKLF